MYDWRKITLPSNVADIQFGTTGIFTVDTEGYTKYIIPGTSSSGSFNKNGDILFKCINVVPYDGDTGTG